jgi:hypothetical protein
MPSSTIPRRIDVPRVPVDFSDVTEFEAVPEGEYEAIISRVEYREAQVEGKYPYLNVECTITEPGEVLDRKVWGIWSLSPKALWRMKQAWENLGILGEDEEMELDYDEDTLRVTEPEIEGLPCMVGVKVEVYEGTDRSRAETFTAIDGGPVKGQKADGKAPKAPKADKKTADKAKAPAGGRRKFK